MGKKKDAAGGRECLSAVQGRALVEQWRRSGLSVSEFCRTRGVREHVLRYRLSRKSAPSKPAAAEGEFFEISASALRERQEVPVRVGPAAAPAGGRAAGAVIVMLPAATACELVQTLRGLLGEALA